MSDCAVKWIKISTSIFDDEKIRYIEQLPDADGILAIWIKLLVLAGQKNAGGEGDFNDEIPYTDEMLAAIFHRKVNTVRLALETFCKLRMIEITADRTIIICNWGKHQHLDGLDKIKHLASERKKRFRSRQREQALLARNPIEERSTAWTGNVPGTFQGVDNGTQHRVTGTRLDKESKEKENKKEKEEKENKKDSLSVTEIEQCDLIQHAEAKRLFGKLCEDVFGSVRYDAQWPDDELHWLNNALPMKRGDWELIDWFYRLPADHEIFDVMLRRQA